MKHFFKRLYFITVALSLLSFNLFAADGDLDLTFNGTGFIATQTLPNRIYIQDDGSILAAGYTAGAAPIFSLLRITKDGQIDASFNPDIAGVGQLFDVLVQPVDRKIVVVGYNPALGFVGPITVVRLNQDGSLDTTFDTAGITGSARGVALQSDGKIVVVGRHASQRVLVLRFNPDGSQDTAFNTNTTDFGPRGEAAAVAIDSQNRAVVVGTESSTAFIPVPNNPALADPSDIWLSVRYNTDGTLENEAIGGTDVTDRSGVANDVVIQPNGQIVIAGYDYPPDTPASANFVVLRANADGSFDKQFTNPGGFQLAPRAAYGLALQADGKIVATGFRTSGALGQVRVVVRYTTAGEPDLTFGNGDGFVFGTTSGNHGTSVAIQMGTGSVPPTGANGNIVVSVNNDLSNNTPAGNVLRLLVDTPPTPVEPTVVTSVTSLSESSIRIDGQAQSPSNVFVRVNGNPILPGTVTGSPWSLTVNNVTLPATVEAFSGYKSGRVNLASLCPILPGPASVLVTAIRNKYCCRPAA